VTIVANFSVIGNVFLQQILSFRALWVSHAWSIIFDGPGSGSRITTKYGEAVACQRIILPALSREYTGVRRKVLVES
jgi:hypothetical protein